MSGSIWTHQLTQLNLVLGGRDRGAFHGLGLASIQLGVGFESLLYLPWGRHRSLRGTECLFFNWIIKQQASPLSKQKRTFKKEIFRCYYFPMLQDTSIFGKRIHRSCCHLNKNGDYFLCSQKSPPKNNYTVIKEDLKNFFPQISDNIKYLHILAYSG